VKHLLTLSLGLSLSCLNAQVQNGGFEALNSVQEPTYWKWISGPFSVGIDTTGMPDSVLYLGGRYSLNTTEVHTGLHAMEIGNGFNFTTNEPYTGTLAASYDTLFTGGFPIDQVLLTERPQTVRFFAEYFPEADDSAFVEVEVTNEWSDVIGTGTLLIGTTVSTYTEFILPITYTASDSAAYMRLAFHTSTPGGTTSLNTRLLIDDVTVENTVNSIVEPTLSARFSLFPNPATDVIGIAGPLDAPVLAAVAIDALGHTNTLSLINGRTVDGSALAEGVYQLLLRTPAGTVSKPLVVTR